MFGKLARGLAIPITALMAATVASCVRVKPYERETHARTTMQERDASEAKLEDHVHEYREGSIGGTGVGGGGCGCN